VSVTMRSPCSRRGARLGLFCLAIAVGGPAFTLWSRTSSASPSVTVRRAETGGVAETMPAAKLESPPRSAAVQLWSVCGVAAYLGYGVKKVVPVVLGGCVGMSPRQWALLAATLLFFGYVEGYRGFQKGFAPRVVSRAWVVSQGSVDGRPAPPVWHKLVAPIFCIGYIHGSRKRVIASWTVTTAVFLVVVGVKRLANPYRAIIDAGVIVGLAWGVVSVLAIFLRSIAKGRPPRFDPDLPRGSPYVLPR